LRSVNTAPGTKSNTTGTSLANHPDSLHRGSCERGAPGLRQEEQPKTYARACHATAATNSGVTDPPLAGERGHRDPEPSCRISDHSRAHAGLVNVARGISANPSCISTSASRSAVPAMAGPGGTEEPANDDDRVGQRDECLDHAGTAFGTHEQFLETAVVPGVGPLDHPPGAGLQRVPLLLITASQPSSSIRSSVTPES